MKRRNRLHGKWHRFIGPPLTLAAFTLFFAAGYGLSRWCFRFTGTPPEIFSYVIASLLGFACFGIVLKLIVSIKQRHSSDPYSDFNWAMNDILEAMQQISRGDFTALVATDNEWDPFKKLADSVNQMARDLGSMEQLRQEFISNVSHEIQSPLTSISGFAALLRASDLPEETRIHYIDIIETESKRLSKLSENLLKLSSLEAEVTPLNPQDFRLDKQLEQVVLLLEPQWTGKNLNPNLELAPVVFCGDEELLSQVWINLLHNAIKFTPEGGEFSLTLNADAETICAAVTDTGSGIPAEDQRHLFERFYKVDKSRDRSLGGNGLGLSLVKKIVELHRGTVTVQSAPGQGSSFTVRLPKA
jgi:signal transduction histidine kinase